jgi:hypothetical protein
MIENAILSLVTKTMEKYVMPTLDIRVTTIISIDL